MVTVHPTALVDAGAQLGVDVAVGPFAWIMAGARVGDGCRIGAQVVLHGSVTLGRDCVIDTGAVLGGAPQVARAVPDDTALIIGERTTCREFVTLHRAMVEGAATRIGDDCLFMATSHAGHDVQVGHGVQVANAVLIAGHCVIGDRAIIGGMTALHQRVSVGTLAMVGGGSGLNSDVPPYALARGNPADTIGINVIGLRRSGMSDTVRDALRRAIRELYCSGRHRGRVLDELTAAGPHPPEVQAVLDFTRATQAGRNGRQLEQA